jgi:hypothetical protein
MTLPGRAQQIGLLVMLAALVALAFARGCVYGVSG